MFARVRPVELIGLVAAVLTAAACSQGRAGTAERGSAPDLGELQANEEGTYAFRWTSGEAGRRPVEVQVLEVVRLSDEEVVFRDDQRFRARDVNAAAWSSTPNVLLGYSGDVGTATIGPPGDDGRWTILDSGACLDAEQAAHLDQDVADRLPHC